MSRSSTSGRWRRPRPVRPVGRERLPAAPRRARRPRGRPRRGARPHCWSATEVLAPAGQLAVLAGGPRVALGTGQVHGEPAGAGAVDAVALLAAIAGGPIPVGQQHALEALLLHRGDAHADGDLLKPLQRASSTSTSRCSDLEMAAERLPPTSSCARWNTGRSASET